MLILKDLVGLHKTVQLQLLQHYWSGHRLGLLWYWMVCLRNKQRSLRHFWGRLQVLHFRLFCWLYRASPSLAAKNIINLISVLTIWLCPCGESSLVLLEEGVCYDQCIFLAKLYQPLPCFIPHSKAKFASYSRCFLTSYFCIPVPYNDKDIFWGVSSKRSCRSS